MDAQECTESEEPATVGKAALPFQLYAALALKALQAGQQHMLLGHAYLVLTWNLMCRSTNTSHIALGRLGWVGDSLLVNCSLTKSGTREHQKDPLHLYANPHQPQICPVLALALYFISLGASVQLLSSKGLNKPTASTASLISS